MSEYSRHSQAELFLIQAMLERRLAWGRSTVEVGTLLIAPAYGYMHLILLRLQPVRPSILVELGDELFLGESRLVVDKWRVFLG